MASIKIRVCLFSMLLPFLLDAQNIYTEPSDTLVDPSLFNSSELIVAWADDWCPVKIQTDGDTIFVACYTVTYRDHYTASIDLCPGTINDVGGIGLFNEDPRLVDSILINDMEADGSNLTYTDGVQIHYKNLTTGETLGSGHSIII